MSSPRLAVLLCAASSLLAIPLPAPAADLRVTSRVDAVTVYRSAARVTRVAHLELPGGDSRVLLEGLPAGLDDESLRVEGKGTARARVFGVTAEPFTRAEAALPEVRAAEERLEGLQGEDRTQDDRIAQARARAKFVESLRASSLFCASAFRTSPAAAPSWASTKPTRSAHSLALTPRTARFLARSSE